MRCATNREQHTGMPVAWTFGTLLEDLAGRGEASALIAVAGDTAHTLSYGALAKRARALAGGLATLGVAAGEPVALLAPNGVDWVVARLALGALGVLVLALDELSSEADLRIMLADSGCRRGVTAPSHAAALHSIEPRLDLIVMGETALPGARSWNSLFDAAAPFAALTAPDAPAMLVYTSGTTGPPKSFVLSYANLWANLRSLVAAQLVGPADAVLVPLPLHHVYPFLVGLLTCLCSGACIVFPEAASGPQIMAAIRLAEVSAIVGVPRLYTAIIAALEARLAASRPVARIAFRALLDFSVFLRRRWGIAAGRYLFERQRCKIGPRLRLLVSGGARLEPEVLWPLVGLGFDVRSGYGLAETASIFTGNLPGCERMESEGRPFQGGELRIADPDDQGVGEIELRGPNICTGYRHSPEANAEAFTPDGWFRTGDLGRLDADGFLYIAGRRKETIVLGGGKKVHPEELEKLYGASPYMREIAVLERSGSLVALVVPNLEAVRSGPTIRVDEAIRVALATRAQGLPSYQRLAGFALARAALPRTRLGKYQRFLLPALYERALAGGAAPMRPLGPADEALLAQAAARQIYDLLATRYPGKALNLDAHPQLDLGIDSLEWLSLSLILAERFGLHFVEADIANLASVRDLLRLAVSRAPGADMPQGAVTRRLQAEDAQWLKSGGFGSVLLGLLLYALNRIVMRSAFRLRVEGANELPADGPYILVANHGSDLDPALLAAALDYRKARQLAWGGDATRLFTKRWPRPLLRALHVFPVDERTPARTLALAEAALKRGRILVWFPESWRSPDGALQRFLPGIGWLVENAKVAVVPAYIAGSFEAMPRESRLPRLCPIRVCFGKPLSAATLRGLAGEGVEAHQRVADALQQRLAGLGGQCKP
jgi:long-chain acyl-CoA synthetase